LHLLHLLHLPLSRVGGSSGKLMSSNTIVVVEWVHFLNLRNPPERRRNTGALASVDYNALLVHVLDFLHFACRSSPHCLLLHVLQHMRLWLQLLH
ncbi:hypothetical protein PFISCL1PPCAC_9290, partial [Pristionchus fissidentatus]